MYYVYILQSTLTDRRHVGSTHDMQLRLAHHNDGWSRSTKSGRPWRIVYTEEHPDRSSAIRREFEIKRRKSRRYRPLRKKSSIWVFFYNSQSLLIGTASVFAVLRGRTSFPS